jgi:formylglycine-generating enzyme required for sulfatase activity
VTGVTWEEASAFAASKGKRLPTEAEWEYAARGPDGNTYVWGDDWRDDVVGDELHPVGSVAADRSKFDVFDMAGNASEWTSSDLVPYPKSTYVIEAEHRFNKMFRGGNVRIAPNKRKVGVAAWYRQSKRPDQASDHLGFRCAQDVPN